MALPEKVSLADVLANVFVSPAEASHLLQAWAREHSGGAQTELSNKLIGAAIETTNPDAEQYNKAESEAGFKHGPVAETP